MLLTSIKLHFISLILIIYYDNGALIFSLTLRKSTSLLLINEFTMNKQFISLIYEIKGIRLDTLP